MILLPLRALGMFVKSPRLFALGFFPGLFTAVVSTLGVYFFWIYQLHDLTFWIAIPSAFLLIVLLWLIVGKVALVPVEDAIIDECQRLQLGTIRYPSPAFSPRRILRELGFSLLLAAPAVLVFAIGLIPLFTWIAFFLAAWISAYSFLAPAYARLDPSLGARANRFFRYPFSNFFLGAILNFLLFLPLVNVFLLGYAQVLAALTFLQQVEKDG